MEYSDSNIYSKEGILLLSKGTAITGEMREKLEHLGYHFTPRPENSPKQDVANSRKQIKDTFHLEEERLLNQSSDILDQILFDSKSKPYWIHINTLSNYVDWLYTHSLDVSLISVMISQVMALDEALIQKIALGAMLHDIGKLMIPSKIIQKKGNLTSQEMFFMKQHCELGYSMLQEYHLDSETTDTILQHHERLDGSGYPNGLRGEKIPIHSRIVMFADTLDAMTSYRPYKKSKDVKAAIRELQKRPDKYPQEVIKAFTSFLP